MPAVVNVADFIKIGIMASVFIWGVNKGLTKINLDEYKA